MAQNLTIVAGMHRSGTSLMAKMLEVFGIVLPGDIVGPAVDNEKGFFEDRGIIALNDEVMFELGLRWDSLSGFFLGPEDFSSPRFDVLKDRARSIVRERELQHEHWAFKDPRFSRLTGFWLPILASEDVECRIIIALRRPGAVAASLATRNQFPVLKSVYLWFLHTLDILLATQNFDRMIVSYERLMSEPRAVLDEFEGFLPAPIESIRNEFLIDFISSDLNHHQDANDAEVFAPATRLFNQLDTASPLAIDHQQLFSLIPDSSDQALLGLITEQEVLVFEREDRLKATIQEFKNYQLQLEQNVREKEAWGKKLDGDVAALRNGAGKLKADVLSLKTSVSDLDTKVLARDEQLRDAEESLRALDRAHEVLSADSKAESVRLWAIIEKYRIEVEVIEGSLSWRVTGPLRWIHRVVKRAPGVLFRKSLALARWLVFLLPADSMLRARIIKTYDRFRALLKGDVDNESVRDSHRELVSNRQQMLVRNDQPDIDILPDLDISIVTYNSERWVEGFVSSLRAQTYPLAKLRLFVVDNGSDDDTVACLEQVDWSDFGGFSLCQNDNLGFGGGHNVGVSDGQNEFVLVTNVDIEFTKDCLTRALGFAVSDSAEIASWELRQAPYEHPKFYDPVSLLTGWSAHACIVFRRSAFEAVGGYESRIFMYGEDVELSYRLRSQGYRLRYLPFAVVNHYTYEEPGEVKLLQYQGSTLANAYIRLRYGSLMDVLRIFPMFSRLLLSVGTVPNQRQIVWGNIRKLARNAPYFFRHRTATHRFSFRAWDYDIVRDGAFYESRELVSPYPLVSVITRTYRGRENLLHECMQSVANQTYPNMEHIIVEDGGEEMRTTVSTFQERFADRIVRYFPLEKGGRCIAGNEGLARAHGEYLVFLDDDDLFFADHVEVCVSELQADETVSGVYALAWEVETEFETGSSDSSYEEMSHGTPAVHFQPFDQAVLIHHNVIPIQALVFDRTLYERHGGFDPALDNLEDWNLWVRYTSDADFKFIEKTTSMYRTPWDLDEKSRRQAVLDDYLEEAMAKNREALLAVGQREQVMVDE
ncbi:MAG: GT2 family glycosyltransferase [Candidatus Azotimanducaceae bacterium]|jgi:GT2 family glycosyltransferase